MMMQPVLHSFGYALDYLRELVADVSPADRVAQPGGIVNHPAWVIGHLTHSCELLCGVIGLPPWLPETWAKRFGTGWIKVPAIKRPAAARRPRSCGTFNRNAALPPITLHKRGIAAGIHGCG